ncbi:MAG: aldehyde dehydrogenase family protein [Bdellovibrionota bacterium]
MKDGNYRAIAKELKAGLKAGRLFVDGEFVRARSKKKIAVINPATQELLTDIAEAQADDVNNAVASAQRAFESEEWRSMDAAARGRLLWKIGDLIEKHKTELAVLESLSNGKTVTEALRGDIPPAWDIFRYYAGWANKYHGETIPVDGPYLNYTLREPVGVVGAIVAWNYPLLLACWKIAPALAMGNTVVLKPAEQTPLTALYFAELLNKAGVPPGVVNVVTGAGQTGSLLARHPGVDKIAFTGSTETGRRILQASAESNLKRVSLELGGKSPNIVFADADLDVATQSAFRAIFANKGEICSAGSRLLVERRIYDEMVDRLREKAAALKVGDPLDPETGMGAQVSRAQLRRVLGYIELGKKEGARVAAGGGRDKSPENRRGNFVKPTVFTDVKSGMKIAQEEIFGPVLCVIPFDGPEEAAKIANHSRYGLVAAVWTRDVGLAHALARKIRAGSVWINTYNGFDSASPFGGCKESGMGREMGVHALESYTHVKSVWVALDRDVKA